MVRFFTHSLVLAQKNGKLKLRSKLATLLEFLLPIMIIAMLIGFFWMLIGIQRASDEDAKYNREALPSMSAKDFDKDGGQLLYAPAGHAAVECLLRKLKTLASPTRDFVGFATEDELLAYAARLYFKQRYYWAGLVFNLNEQQVNTGQFYTSNISVVVRLLIFFFCCSFV